MQEVHDGTALTDVVSEQTCAHVVIVSQSPEALHCSIVFRSERIGEVEHRVEWGAQPLDGAGSEASLAESASPSMVDSEASLAESASPSIVGTAPGGFGPPASSAVASGVDASRPSGPALQPTAPAMATAITRAHATFAFTGSWRQLVALSRHRQVSSALDPGGGWVDYLALLPSGSPSLVPIAWRFGWIANSDAALSSAPPSLPGDELAAGNPDRRRSRIGEHRRRRCGEAARPSRRGGDQDHLGASREQGVRAAQLTEPIGDCATAPVVRAMSARGKSAQLRDRPLGRSRCAVATGRVRRQQSRWPVRGMVVFPRRAAATRTAA